MKHILLENPFSQGRQLSFYLAMEDYVASKIDEPEAFFTWQVAPTVIIGRNQILENEVDVAYCRQHGINIFRRKSGGGCVYADEDNLMLSFIAHTDNVAWSFNCFTGMLTNVLTRLGLKAVVTDHNDVLVDGQKVSGTACRQLFGHCIVHSTLLYDTNMQHMLHAITPSTQKLQRKGVKSVDQRITLLRNYMPDTPLSQLNHFICTTLCKGSICLGADNAAAIEQIEQEYLSSQFIQKM